MPPSYGAPQTPGGTPEIYPPEAPRPQQKPDESAPKPPRVRPDQTPRVPKLEVGEVKTLPPGEKATVTIEEKDGKVVLHFGIPRGNDGAPGPQGPPGQPASINVEALAAAIRDTLPPITVNSVDASGKVMDTVQVPLGGVLNIHHKPIRKQ